MGKVVGLIVVVLVAMLAATTTASGRERVAAACGDNVLHPGTLTVGTDNPAFPPWFGGGAAKGSTWKINDPSTGKGFESAVVYAVAKKLGFTHANVNWGNTPFPKPYAPGKKALDFDINKIPYPPGGAKALSFSSSYYAAN